MNSLIYIFRILSEYATSVGGKNKRWDHMEKSRFRSLFISEILPWAREWCYFLQSERRRQSTTIATKVQRWIFWTCLFPQFYSSLTIFDVFKVCDDWTPSENNSRETQLLCSFNGHWKIFHVRINCRWLTNNCLSAEKKQKRRDQVISTSDRSVWSKRHRLTEFVCWGID